MAYWSSRLNMAHAGVWPARAVVVGVQACFTAADTSRSATSITVSPEPARRGSGDAPRVSLSSATVTAHKCRFGRIRVNQLLGGDV